MGGWTRLRCSDGVVKGRLPSRSLGGGWRSKSMFGGGGLSGVERDSDATDMID